MARSSVISLISVVDDDASVRESLHGLLRSVGFAVHVFASAETFLQSADLSSTDCLVLDVQMRGLSGLDLQGQLGARGVTIPIVFITAHGDEKIASQALAGGAVAVLVKPFSEEALLEALDRALRPG